MAQLYPQALLFLYVASYNFLSASTCPPKGTHRKHASTSSYIVVYVCVAAEACFQSRCLAMAANGSTILAFSCYVTVSQYFPVC
jgi:hypothetical protein